MPARIRLQRYGKKHKPFYHIVIADGRAPRDGRFIETIGTYNPLTNPADIVLDFDKALDWLHKGAQPSDSVRAILSYNGVLYKNHLLKGVKKGALTEEQAEARFEIWLNEKNAKIDKKRSEEQLGIKELKKQRLAEEAKINEAKAAVIAKKKAVELEKQVEKAQSAVAEEVVYVQEEEVRTPKQVELREAIEEKAKAKAEAEVDEKAEDKVEETTEETLETEEALENEETKETEEEK